MKRTVVIVGTVLVASFAAISVWKHGRGADYSAVDEGSTISAEKKAEVRRFWNTYRRATSLKLQGAWAEAASAYREALEINPVHEDALYSLGNVLFELERYEEAATAWRRLIEANSHSTRAHIQLGAVYSCGASGAPFDLGIAEKEFQMALAINKEETGPILKLGEVCLLSGQRQRALTHFTAVVQSNVRSVPAHYLIGYLRWLEGEVEESRNALQQAVSFSRTKQSDGPFVGEGDTRSGKGGPLLAEGEGRKSFFASHWTALSAWQDQTITIPRMEEEYREVDRRVKRLVGEVSASP
jgi:tetratricopeptide (TPR) repeat protein